MVHVCLQFGQEKRHFSMILCLQEEPLVIPVDETPAFVACAVCVCALCVCIEGVSMEVCGRAYVRKKLALLLELLMNCR